MVKYSIPYFDDKNDDHHHVPPPIRKQAIQRFVETFGEIFNQRDLPSVIGNIARSQMYLSRAEAYAWASRRLGRVKDSTIPYCKLLDQAFTKDSRNMAKLFAEITHPYLDAQEMLYISLEDTTKAVGPHHTFRARFTKMHQRYVQLYENVGNVLLSAAAAAMDILSNQSVKTAKEYLTQDAFLKIERLQKSVLVTGLSDTTRGLINHVRNAVHGGSITYDVNKETMLLQDKSKWRQEYSEEEFQSLLGMCEETCEGLGLGYMFFDFKHATDVHVHRKVSPPTDEEFSQLCFYLARGDGLEVEKLQTASGVLQMEMRFTPKNPYGSQGAVRYADGRVEHFEEAAWNPDPVDQVLGFLMKIYNGLVTMDSPFSASIIIRRYGDEKTADFTIKDLSSFITESRELEARAQSMDEPTIIKEKERMRIKYMVFKPLPKESEGI